MKYFMHVFMKNTCSYNQKRSACTSKLSEIGAVLYIIAILSLLMKYFHCFYHLQKGDTRKYELLREITVN